MRVKSRRRRCRIEFKEFARVVRQIPDDQFVAVRRVHRQRPDHRQTSALARIHPRQVDKGPADADFGVDRVLAAQPQAEVPQPRLSRAYQPRQAQRGAHVR